MISRIITQYLSKNKRLVVPDFGAFIRKDSGEVVFMEFLKKDDRILTSLVSRVYNVSEEQANLIIAKFISDVKEAGTQGNGYVIEGLGVMRASSDGLYHLDYNPSAKASVEPKVQQEKPRQETIHDRIMEEQKQAPPSSQIVPEPTPAPTQQYYQQPSQVRQVEPQQQQRQPAQEVRREERPSQEQYHTAPREQQRQREPQRQQYDRAPNREQQQRPTGQQRPPGRPPRRPTGGGGGKKRADTIMIVAIIAALIAIGSIVFGVFVNVNPRDSMRSTQEVEELGRQMDELTSKPDSLSIDSTELENLIEGTNN